mmetsp:Transcript_21926/g.62652  ORF Transcript_21926/g.62652 Transcript_21926/m.62652 type:complete len:236 (+) Transcript_21926:368-1075(+)
MRGSNGRLLHCLCSWRGGPPCNKSGGVVRQRRHCRALGGRVRGGSRPGVSFSGGGERPLTGSSGGAGRPWTACGDSVRFAPVWRLAPPRGCSGIGDSTVGSGPPHVCRTAGGRSGACERPCGCSALGVGGSRQPRKRRSQRRPCQRSQRCERQRQLLSRTPSRRLTTIRSLPKLPGRPSSSISVPRTSSSGSIWGIRRRRFVPCPCRSCGPIRSRTCCSRLRPPSGRRRQRRRVR